MNGRQGKELGLSGAAVLASVPLWWLIARAAAEPHPILVMASLIAALLWVALAAIALALIAKGAAAAVIALTAVSSMLVGLLQAGALAAAGMLIPLLLAARRHARRELAARKKFQTIPVFLRSAEWLMMGAFIVAAGLSLAPIADNLSNRAIAIPEYLIQYTADATAAIFPEIPSADLSLAAHTTAAALNQRLTNVVRSNPFTTAIITMLTLLVFSRLLVSLLAWPAAGAIDIFIRAARSMGVITVLQQEETTETITL